MKIQASKSAITEVTNQRDRLGADPKGWGDITDRLVETISAPKGQHGKVGTAGLIDMFKLQMHMNRLHLRVELCSKVAEAASATVKKLQQAQ